METRTLLKLGKSSIVAVLPKKWCEGMGLKRGDEVKIKRMGDGTLRIIPKGIAPVKGRKINIDISKIKDDKVLERLLVAHYLEGADEIFLTTSEHNSEKLNQVVENFLSIIGEGEVGEREENRVQLLIDSKTEEFSMEQLISDMFANLLSMFTELKKLVKLKDKTKKDDVIRFEERIDSLYLFALRKIIKVQKNRALIKNIGLKSPLWLLGNRIVIKSIEQTADSLNKLLGTAVSLVEEVKLKEETEEALIEFIEEIEDMIPEIINCFLDIDTYLSNSLFEKINAFQSKIYELMEMEEDERIYNEFLLKLAASLEPLFGVLEVSFNRRASEKPQREGVEAKNLQNAD